MDNSKWLRPVAYTTNLSPWLTYLITRMNEKLKYTKVAGAL